MSHESCQILYAQTCPVLVGNKPTKRWTTNMNALKFDGVAIHTELNNA